METYSFKPDKSAGRGKETLFRVTFRNQINLVQIADNKANMIISINSTIIAVIMSITGFGSVQDTFETNTLIIIPVTLIVITCLTSVVFAIQAARPHLIKSQKDRSTGKLDKISMLFFGNIADKSLNEYLGVMDDMLKSRNEVYEQMTIDIYNQGKVLKRKYNLLSVAYLIFMFGFIFSVVAFLILILFR